jgi:hypothetical protein
LPYPFVLFLSQRSFYVPRRWFSPPIPKVIDSVQITKDGLHKDITLRLLTDGTRLYFQEGSFAGPLSSVVPVFTQSTSLIQVSTREGETARSPVALKKLLIYDFSIVRSEFLAGDKAIHSSVRFGSCLSQPDLHIVSVTF